MNKRILVYLPTTILPLLFGANIATAQNMNDSIINQQVADSLAKNKKYQKFIKTAKINEPSVRYYENRINTTNAKIENLKQSYFAQTLNSLNRKSKLGNFFTPKQIEQINQELNSFGSNITLTKDSTLDELRGILVKHQIETNQLPINGRAVVMSKYKEYDLRTFGTWAFVDFDRNNLYLQYINTIKTMHDIPKTDAFLQLCEKLYKYKEQYEQLSLAKQRAVIIKNAVTDYFHKSK